MKLTINLLFAFAMIVSLAFFGEIASSHNPLSAQAQTRSGTVTVKRKSNVGIARKASRGAKYIYRKGRNGVVYIYRKTAKGVVYVGKKTYQGGKYVGKKTVQGTKYVGKKTYKTGRKVVSRAKKILY